MDDGAGHGWRISEVERLTGLSRRDIQRCCYEGKGGVGILSPKGSSWDRRLYDRHDVATLFVVACYRRRGLTLPQVKEVFDRHPGRTGLRELLDEECERGKDQLAEVLGQLVSAKAFRASLGDDHDSLLAGLFRQVATVHAALRPDRTSLDEILAQPGVETLVELWLGGDGGKTD